MHYFVKALQEHQELAVFLVVGLGFLIGRLKIGSFSLGTVVGTLLAGVLIGQLDIKVPAIVKAIFFDLFLFTTGYKVGPQFFRGLKKDALPQLAVTVVLCVTCLLCAFTASKFLGYDIGTAAGLLAGAFTESTVIGTAEMAMTQGAYKVPAGSTAEGVSAMIALGYGISYIWGTVGIILVCKYLPKWWGVDARKAAKEYEEAHGVPNLDDAGITGYRPAGLRAYRLENKETAGKTIAQFRQSHPEYRVVNVVRGAETLGANADLVMQAGDVVALGGRLEDLTAKMGLVGPEVHDVKALNIPLDQAEILVTEKSMEGKVLKEFRNEEFAGQIQLLRIERGGVPIPLGADTELKRFDVLFVAGLKSAVEKVAAVMGKVARPSTGTDLLTLSVGMIVGLLIGAINVPVGGFMVGLGNAGGLLLSGIFVSSAVSRLRFFGSTPNAARNILEDLGLVTFVAIVGINAGASLLSQLTGAIAIKIFLVGFIASSVPPFVTWAIGYHLFKVNAAVLMGGVAGARSHSGPCREAAKEIDSSVPWVGFPVGYAVSGVLLTVFGYFAMIL